MFFAIVHSYQKKLFLSVVVDFFWRINREVTSNFSGVSSDEITEGSA